MNVLESLDELLENVPEEGVLRRLREQLDNFFISLSEDPLGAIAVSLHESLVVAGRDCAGVLEARELEPMAVEFLVAYAGEEDERGRFVAK